MLLRKLQVLLALKGDYKALTGQDWKPGAVPTNQSSGDATSISARIAQQGDKVRDLKSNKADKATIEAEVKVSYFLFCYINLFESISGVASS